MTAVSNLDAENLAMRCEAASYRSGAAAASTYDLCERALGVDPGNVRALIRLASYYTSRVSRVQSPNRAADLQRANSLVCQRARNRPRILCSTLPESRCAGRNPSCAGCGYCRRALSGSESGTMLVGSRFMALPYLQSPNPASLECRSAVTGEVRAMAGRDVLLLKGWAYFLMEKDDEALVWLRRAAAAAPEIPTILAGLASSLALTGHDAEARATLTRYLAHPATQTRTITQWDYIPDDNPAFMKFHLRFKEGLRKAGMPER